MGSSLGFWERKTRAGVKDLGPQPAPPQLAPCSDTHLVFFLRVHKSLGLAEEGGVLGHVGKAGDDFIKVPGDAGQRGRTEGCSPTVMGQT